MEGEVRIIDIVRKYRRKVNLLVIIEVIMWQKRGERWDEERQFKRRNNRNCD